MADKPQNFETSQESTSGGSPDAGESAASAATGRGGPFAGPFGVLVSIALFAAAGYLVWRTFAYPEYAAPDTEPVMYICSETKKEFGHVRKAGEKSPVYSPHSKKNTGYPAEKCFWTKDGKIKDHPTYVLVNEYLGSSEPTLCPDCGRLVTLHNPRPRKGDSGEIIVPDTRTATPTSAGTSP